MMKKAKRFCRVARNYPFLDDEAIEDDLLSIEEDPAVRSLLRTSRRLSRLKSLGQYLLLWFLVLGQGVVIHSGRLSAQTSGNPLAAPYANIGSSVITTGILHNRSPYYLNCFTFDTVGLMLVPDTGYKANPYLYGEGEIEMTSQTFLKLYEDMLFAQVHDSVLVDPVDYHQHLQDARGLYEVPVSMMALQFQRMQEGAMISGGVWFDTLTGTFGPPPDTLWLTDTAFTADTIVMVDSGNYIVFENPDSLFTLAFDIHWLYGWGFPDDFIYIPGTAATLRFGFPSGMLIHNLDSLPGLSVDFGDGNGYRMVPWDTQVDISYQFFPPPKIQQLVIKARFPSLSQDVVLRQVLNIVTNTITPDTIICTDSLPFTCLPSMAHTPATGKISILYADESTRRLTRPVVFIEGFETALKAYGDISFLHVVNGVMPALDFGELAELPILFDQICAKGFDIVYLDFENSRDSIERNVLAAIRAIQWVNQELISAGNHEKIVVAGASMGGLIARYALRQLELDGCCHNTRLYVSFDAPHRGANIPMGMQKLVEVAAHESAKWKGVSWPLSWIEKMKQIRIDLSDPSVESSWELVLNSPAARTMLIQHVDTSARQAFDAFYQTLDEMGYPANCRAISMINGSETGMAHQLEDPLYRLMETGKTLSVPEKWVLLPPPLNCTSIPLWIPVIFDDFTVAKGVAWDESQPFYFEHNDWDQSIETLNTLLNATLLHSGLNVALGSGGIACALLNPALAFFFEVAMVANKGKGNAILQDCHDAAGQTISYPATGLLPLTTLPGGLNNALKKLSGAGDGIMKVYSNAFSFVPSFSSMDVQGMGLQPIIRQGFMDFPLTTTPFNAYWAPRRVEGGQDDLHNLMHVQVTPFNRAWLLDHLQADWPFRATDGRYQGVLSTGYNMAKPGAGNDIIYHNLPHETVLYSLDIVPGGILSVNRQGFIGLPGGTLLPKPAGTFKLVANGDPCDPSLVTIHAGGEMILGDPQNFNKALVHFNPNSTLEIFPGGKLTIHDGSCLIMEKGSTLVIHPGALVSLVGTGAILEMRGKMKLMDHAVFGIDGTGFLRYNTDMTAADHQQYFEAGMNARIQLEASGMEEKKLEIVSDTWFPSSLAVELKSMQVQLGTDRHMHAYGMVSLESVWFRAADTTSFYGSVALYGQKEVFLSQCIFSHGTSGLSANLGWGGYPLQLGGCLFRDNIYGLVTTDEKVRMQQCEFRDNAQTGWQAGNMSGKSVVTGSTFIRNNQSGISFDGQLSASLLLRDCDVSYNHTGVQVQHVLFQAECSRMTHNTLAGIFGGVMAQIDLGAGVKNQITDNHTGILMDRVLWLNLENGANRFSGNQYYVVGELLPNHFPGFLQNIPVTVGMSGNHMPWFGNALPVYVYITHPQTQVSTPVVIDATLTVPVAQTLCYVMPSQNQHIVAPFMQLAGASVIQGGRYHNYLFADALSDAAMKVSCEGYRGNDTLALSCFSDIMDHLPLLLSEGERNGIDYALQLMTAALDNAVEYGEIDPNRGLDGMPVDGYVAMVAERVADRLGWIDVTNPGAAEDEARYQLMLAQMYRLAEHYDYALDILENPENFSGTSHEEAADFWACLCTAERLLLLDSIEQSCFFDRVDSCNLMQSMRRKPFVPVYGTITRSQSGGGEELVRVIYPNPATRVVAIEFNTSVLTMHAELYDAQGRLLWSQKVVQCGRHAVLRLPVLHPGVYLLKVIADEAMSMHQLMINL